MQQKKPIYRRSFQEGLKSRADYETSFISKGEYKGFLMMGIGFALLGMICFLVLKIA